VRIEVEFKSVDRIIPFDALIRPGEYLAAAYPAFEWINEHQERIYTTQKTVQSNVAKAIAWLKHQCGASIAQLADMYGPEKTIEMISREGVPAWSKVPVFTFSPVAIHQEQYPKIPVNLDASVQAW